MGFKLNMDENYEPLKWGTILLRDYPIVFKTKCEELIEQGLASNMEEATKMASDMEVELELYYEKGFGLFAVESGAVECIGATIFSPYTGEVGEENDDDE